MSQSKSIAFVLGNLTVGGSETKIVRLANRLSKKGYDIHIVAIGPPYTLRSQIHSDVAVHCLERRFKFSLRVLFELKRYLVKYQIRSVLCVNLYPLIYGWPVCAMLGKSTYRCMASVNTSELRTFRDTFFMWIYAYFLRRCDIIIFGSAGQRAAWVDRYKLDSDRTVVIYNGVDTDFFRRNEQAAQDIRNDLNIDADCRVVGCIAQLRPEKAHENLIIALKNIVASGQKRVVLLLVGDGPEEKRLRSLVTQYELGGYVRFVGRVDDVRPFLSAFDVFALASTSVEVFSNAMLEAISIGVPAVSSDVGGAAEMITHGKEGFIYERHDIDSLTSYLRALIEDRNLSDGFRKNATARLLRDFTVDRMDADYVKLFGNSSGISNA